MNYHDLTSDICSLVDKNNQWSSAILIPQGDGLLDVSSALMGVLSSTPPVGATNQPTVFPVGKSASFYRFDPDQFYGEEAWPALKHMLVSAGRASGCRMQTRSSYVRVSINQKATYELRCCHGVSVRRAGESTYDGDNVGPSNVCKERIKRIKTGGALRGMLSINFILFPILTTFSFYQFVIRIQIMNSIDDPFPS